MSDALAAVLPALPRRIQRLPVDARGFPVPWFVQWFNDGNPCNCRTGTPDFRVIDVDKLTRAIRQPICWICGDAMGTHRVFLIGPMCAVNRVISEPPSHRECAEFAAMACPFLANPRMRRNETNIPEATTDAAGFGLKRNPQVVCLWETSDYKPFRPHAGAPGILFKLGEPARVDWKCRGSVASRSEVMDSIDSGYPELLRAAAGDGAEAIAALKKMRERAMSLLPALQ